MRAKHALQPWETILVASSVGLAVGRYTDWSAANDWAVQVFAFSTALIFVLCLVFTYVCARIALSMLIFLAKGE